MSAPPPPRLPLRRPRGQIVLGDDDRTVLTQLRALSSLLTALQSDAQDLPATWDGDIILSWKSDGPHVLSQLSIPLAEQLAESGGILFEYGRWDSMSSRERRDVCNRLFRAAADALLPRGLPPALTRLLRRMTARRPVSAGCIGAVAAMGWRVDLRNGLLSPTPQRAGSAHEILELLLACQSLETDPPGFVALGPTAPFVAAAAAHLARRAAALPAGA